MFIDYMYSCTVSTYSLRHCLRILNKDMDVLPTLESAREYKMDIVGHFPLNCSILDAARDEDGLSMIKTAD